MENAPALGTSAWNDPDSFRLLVQGVNDYAIFLLDPTGHIMTWNSGAERIKQYKADEIIGQHFSIFYPREVAATGHPEHELELASREGRYEEEGWRIRKDGTRFWANVVITALRSGDGELRGFAKVTRDLTQKRAAEEALRRSEQRLRLLIDSIRDYAIFMLDADGRIATWNPGAERINGWRAEEILGRHFSIFYPDEEIAAGKCDRELDVAAATGRFEDEGWRLRKDRARFWANVVISAVRDEHGRLVGFAKVTRDLTEQRRADQERLRLAQAEEAVRLRDEFLAIAAHELKTPLTAVMLRAAGIERQLAIGQPDEKGYERLRQRSSSLNRGLDSLEHVVDVLLDTTRVASGRLHLRLEETDLSRVIEDAAASFVPEAARQNGRLTLRIASGLVSRCDPRRLEQVIGNLLSNAIKYGLGKPVELTLERRGSYAVLAVHDHGIGIKPEDQAHIFERFVRVGSTLSFAGLGLGLWITRLIVEGMGGTIAVDSTVDEGSTFVVSLPLVAGTA